MLFNYFRIGGVNGDLNHEFMSRLGDWMSHATEQIEAGQALLNENEIFVRRMRGLGTIDSKTALRMVMTGPNLRATGVPFDVRRAHPYSVYPELEFDIPTRTEGDCLARYLLRMDEIKQSMRIIDQCLHQMPDGPVMAKLPRLLRPRPGRAYAGIEGPRGQYAAYVVSDGTDQPFRMRIHDPSFIHLQAVGVMTPGHLDRRHDGRHGVTRPDHGRRRQVTASLGAPLDGRCRVAGCAPRSRLERARSVLAPCLGSPADTQGSRMTVIAELDRSAAGKVVFTLPLLVLTSVARGSWSAADPRHPGRATCRSSGSSWR